MSDRGGKRKHDGGDRRGGGKDGAGGKRKYWNDNARAHGIPLGTRGVLVSCVTSKETPAGREAISVLSEAYEALRPGAAAAAAAAADHPADGGDDSPPSDIAALLAGEVADLKDRDKQLFAFRTLGIGSLVYVEVRYPEGPSPAELVAQACRRARATGQNTTRLCRRFYPVDHTCAANASEMKALAERVAAKHFPADAQEGFTFSVEFDKRAAPPSMDRMDTINLFAAAVAQPPHKVNLSAQRKTIIVNVVKGTCGVAVVEEWRELGKFNIVTLTTPPEEQGKAGGEAAAAEAEQPAAVAEGSGEGEPAEEA